MKYALIIVLIVNNGFGTTTEVTVLKDFDTELKCVAAKEKLTRGIRFGYSLLAECIELDGYRP